MARSRRGLTCIHGGTDIPVSIPYSRQISPSTQYEATGRLIVMDRSRGGGIGHFLGDEIGSSVASTSFRIHRLTSESAVAS